MPIIHHAVAVKAAIDAMEDDHQRCDHWPPDRLRAAQCVEKGLLIRRALVLMGAQALDTAIKRLASAK